MNWQPGHDDLAPMRNIGVTQLSEDAAATADARRGIVGWIVGTVDLLYRKIANRRHTTPFQQAPQPIRDVSRLAADAAAGKLQGASLEGEIALAQIAEAYAQARKANAEAASIDEQRAWMRVQNTLDLCEKLGVKVEVGRLPGGNPGLFIGDGLVAAALPSTYELPADTSRSSGDRTNASPQIDPG